GGQHVSDGLDPSMRMPGESGQVVIRHVVAKIVQQEKRIVVARLAEAEGAAKMNAGAFERWFGHRQLFHGSHRHGELRIGGPKGPHYCLYFSTSDAGLMCARLGSSPNSRKARRWRSRSQ